MLIEVSLPLIHVKHSIEGPSNLWHTFEVWYLPDDGTEPFLVLTFEGDLEEARAKCRTWLDFHHANTTALWIEKS